MYISHMSTYLLSYDKAHRGLEVGYNVLYYSKDDRVFSLKVEQLVCIVATDIKILFYYLLSKFVYLLSNYTLPPFCCS